MVSVKKSKPYQIKDKIQKWIYQEKFNYGEMIPSERKLSKKFNVSRTTIRNALNILIDEGLLMNRQGTGTFVCKTRFEEGMNYLISYTQDMINRGLEPSSKVIEIKKQKCDWNVMNKLNLEKDKSIIKIKRLRLANDEPMTIQTSILPYEKFRNIEEFNFENSSLTKIIEDNYGYKIINAVQKIRARKAKEQESKMLDIPTDSSVLRGERVSYTYNNEPIELLISVYRGDRYDIVINLIKKEKRASKNN